MTITAEDRIAQLEARVGQLEAVISGLRALFGGGSGAITPAPDRDLDSQYGDEKVKFDPRDWTGERHKGRMMSRSDPELLDLYAETMAYFASTATDPKKAGYDKKSAARAAGWARRIRGGWKPPAAPPAPTFGGGAPGFGAGSGGGGSRRFGGPPAAPDVARPPPTADPTDVWSREASRANPPADDDISFDFGANARPPVAAPAPDDDFDDDPPL